MSLTSNLIAYYKLDEASGDAADSSGGGFTLTNSSASYAAGKINNGASMNAAGQKLSTTSGLGLSSTGAFTVSFWFNRNSIAFGTGTEYFYLTPGTANLSWAVYIPNSTTIQFDHARPCVADDYLTYTPSTMSTSTWYHVVMTFDGTTLTGYFNGSSVGTSTPSGLGSCSDATGFKLNGYGLTDEVGVWSRALTGAEVTSLYNSGAGLSYPFSASTPTPRLRSLLGVGL